MTRERLGDVLVAGMWSVAIFTLPLWALLVIGMLQGIRWLASPEYSERDWQELRERTRAN